MPPRHLAILLGGILTFLGGIAAANPPILLGYIMGGEEPVKFSPKKLDVVNYAFGHVRVDGEVFLPEAHDPARLREVVAGRAQNPGLKVVLSIGGWGVGNFSEAVSGRKNRARFIESSVDLIHEYKLDGVDIDWEYPTLDDAGISASPGDKRNFTKLLEALRKRLDEEGEKDGKHYLLTIAAAEGRFSEGLDFPRIAKSLDWINLMTYDFYGSLTPTTGHHSGLARSPLSGQTSRNIVAALEYFTRHDVPMDKIILGVPFYGRSFGDVEPANEGRFQKFASDGGFITWREIVATRLGKEGWERHWDADALVPWLWNPSERRFITYDDPTSLALKAEYVRQHGLAGIMFWELHADNDEELIDVLNKALKAR